MPYLVLLQLMIRLMQLRQLRVQTGVLDLQPPHNEAGTPCYRGAAGDGASRLLQDLPILLCLLVSCKSEAAAKQALLPFAERVNEWSNDGCRANAHLDQPPHGACT
jgi:hypothetical protein